MPSTKMSFFKVKKSDKFHPKTTRNTSRSQLIQGLDTNIHCLAVELSGWIPLFTKPLKVILSKYLVIIRVKLLNVNIKQFPVWVVNINVQMYFSYIAYPLPVIVRGVCLFDNFEKLSMLLGLSR